MNNSKGAGFEDGDFTVIASTVDDPDNSKMFVWDGSKFTYISDLSGAQGIQGPVGPKGDKGDVGPQGAAGATYQPYIATDGNWHVKLVNV